MSFEDQFEQDAQELGINTGSGDFWKPKEGANMIRVLTEPIVLTRRYGYGVCYSGAEYCKKENLKKDNASLTVRYLTWIIDRADGNFYLYEMPYRVAKQLVNLKKDEGGTGTGFEEFSPPYDTSLNVKNAGTTDVEYDLSAARQDRPLTQAEQDALEECTLATDILERMKEKARKRYEGGEDQTNTKANQDEALREQQKKADEDAQQQGIDPNDIPFD